MIIGNIFMLSVPLLLVSFGALISEQSGRMAVFAEGVINLCAFLCFLFVTLTHSLFLGTTLAIFFSTLFIVLVAIALEYTKANPFLTSLGLNLFISGTISCISSLIYKTSGVLVQDTFSFDALSVRFISSIIGFLLLTIGILFLFFTKMGLYIRITGTSPDVLLAKGVNVARCKIVSWGLASFFASTCGAILAIRLSAFTPNISSGKGYLALACVFLGKKTVKGVILSVIAITITEYIAINFQNFFPEISKTFLLALPYIAALVFIFLQKNKTDVE